jgi:DNA-binding NtrC family response regulator
LHQLSPRRNGPFQAINLGALPRELAEAELFGHERGAFTGAAGQRAGVFELADRGTLLLDELGELPLDMQAKLLRVLETGEVRRLGARASKQVDVRVVAATWAPLEQRIVEGTFREDLFHRVAVLVIDVPSLRERRCDVPAIAQALLARSNDFSHKSLSPSAASRLASEPWPGNVRELRNVLFRAAAIATGETIDGADVARALTNRTSQPPPRPHRDPRSAVALVKTHGTIAAAARAAGVPRETMRDWVHGQRRG